MAQDFFNEYNFDNFYLGYSHLIKLTSHLYHEDYESLLYWRNCVAIRKDFHRSSVLLQQYQRVPSCEGIW